MTQFSIFDKILKHLTEDTKLLHQNFQSYNSLPPSGTPTEETNEKITIFNT